MLHAPRATVDLGALTRNLAVARACAPNSRLLAVVKGDGYGHGMLAIARHLSALADGLAVARMESALRLRAGGVNGRILVTAGHSDRDAMQTASRHGLALMLHAEAEVDALERSMLAAPLEVWLKVDTGMHRLGVRPAAYPELRARLMRCAQVSGLVQCTHFASAARHQAYGTQRQLRQFLSLCAGSDAPRSCANSSALLGMPSSHCEWIRPGIMLYGHAEAPLPEGLSLRAVMRLQAPLIAVREVASGETIGYDGAWRARQRCRIGSVAIGYADGYPRNAPNGTPVMIAGQRATLAGRVSMDMIGVDLSDCPRAAVGDAATLWGPALPVDEIAARAGTNVYDLLTGVSAHVERCYVGGEALSEAERAERVAASAGAVGKPA